MAIEVTAGVSIARYLPPALINRLAGIVFLGLGGLSLIRELIPKRDKPLKGDLIDM